ncbi:MAG: metal ABC transporter substrate-binding protein [Lachnospiraceae bacterium]|nr:metal ABC transporter substrate-binding protein [Lachnospiraceae bacterium]
MVQSGSEKGKESDKKEEETVKIVTSFYPLYIMMLNLADGIDGIELDNMAEPQTGCLHDYQLRPRDLVCLEDADIFLANGGGMEEFLSDVLEAYPDLNIIYAIDGLSEEDLLEGHEHDHEGHAHAEETDTHEEKELHEVEEEAIHGEEEHEVNPHTWMNMELYKKEISYIAQTLAQVDPANQDAYKENEKRYTEKIDDLIEEYAALKQKEEKPGCVLLHESFVYLAEEYGYPVLETLDVEKDSGFSAKEMRELIDEVGDAGNGVIVSDSQYSGNISTLLAQETGMERYQLDSGVSGEYEKDAYLTSMRKNLEELKRAAD